MRRSGAHVAGFLGPDDAILSVTPLWPRPDRSPWWVVSWVLILALWLILMMAEAEDNFVTLHYLKQSIHAAVATTGFNEITSPGAFWAWLEVKWTPSVAEMMVTFPTSGALDWSRQRPSSTRSHGPYVMAGRSMDLRQKVSRGPVSCAEGLRVSGLEKEGVMCYSKHPPTRDWDPLDGEAGRPTANGYRLVQHIETGKSVFTASACSAACTEFVGTGGERCQMAVWAAGESMFYGQWDDQVLGAMMYNSWPYYSAAYTSPAYYADWSMPCYFSIGELSGSCAASEMKDDVGELPVAGRGCIDKIPGVFFKPGGCDKEGGQCVAGYARGDDENRGDLASEMLLPAVGRSSQYTYDGAEVRTNINGISVALPGVRKAFDYTKPSNVSGAIGALGFETGGHTFVLSNGSNVTGDSVLSIRALRSLNWVSRHTAALIVDSWVAAPSSGAAARVEMVMETPPSGRFKPSVHVSAIRTSRYGRPGGLGLLAIEVFAVVLFLLFGATYHTTFDSGGPIRKVITALIPFRPSKGKRGNEVLEFKAERGDATAWSKDTDGSKANAKGIFPAFARGLLAPWRLLTGRGAKGKQKDAGGKSKTWDTVNNFANLGPPANRGSTSASVGLAGPTEDQLFATTAEEGQPPRSYGESASTQPRQSSFKGSRPSKGSGMTTGVQSGRQVLELSAIRKGVWPVEETGESIAAVEALSAEDNLAPTLLESIAMTLKYIEDDMWLILDLVLAAVLIARLYLSFSYGLTAELSAAGIANVSSMDRLSAVSVVLLIAGSCRFWRSFRFVVMLRRFFIKAAPSLVAVSIFIVIINLAFTSSLAHLISQQGFRNYEMGFMALLHLCVSEDFTLEDPNTWGGLTTKLLGNYNLPEKALHGSPRRSPMQRGGRGVSTDHTGVVKTCVSSAFFFLATCILCPLSVAVVVHAADRARRPETRNDRPLTEREQMIYHKAFLQDLSLLYAFLKDKKRHFVAWLNSRRFGITAGEIPKFELPEDDFVPTELEPYTDADMFRSVLEMVDEAQEELGGRMVATTQLMMRTAAPLINTLDMLQSVALVLREAGIEEEPEAELQDVKEEGDEVGDEGVDEEGKQLEDLVLGELEEMGSEWGGEGEISEVATPDPQHTLASFTAGGMHSPGPSVEGTIICEVMSVRGVEAPDEKSRQNSCWCVRLCVGKQHRYTGDLDFVRADDETVVDETFMFATGKLSVGTSIAKSRFEMAVVNESSDTIGIPTGSEERLEAEIPHVLASTKLSLRTLPEARVVEGWQSLSAHGLRCKEAEVYIRLTFEELHTRPSSPVEKIWGDPRKAVRGTTRRNSMFGDAEAMPTGVNRAERRQSVAARRMSQSELALGGDGPGLLGQVPQAWPEASGAAGAAAAAAAAAGAGWGQPSAQKESTIKNLLTSESVVTSDGDLGGSQSLGLGATSSAGLTGAASGGMAARLKRAFTGKSLAEEGED